jgi:WD40 repeat protein
MGFFDIRTPPQPTLSIILERSVASGSIVEINRPAFSPDGLLLALPRSDNVTHVYDSRFLSAERGPVLHLAHGPHKTQASSQFHYGVVCASWVSNDFGCPRTGLVTGGNDGAVPYFWSRDTQLKP